jgi:hypothetical protein
MCYFHSTAWRLIGQDVQMAHLGTNSHAEMIKVAGWKANQPNRQTVIYEAEWSGEGDMPPVEKLIRNSDECPEKVQESVKNHYGKLQEAIQAGKHLDANGYFKDASRWYDVWSNAMQKGHMPDFQNVTSFASYVTVLRGATFHAPVLAEVASYVIVAQGATFQAPALAKAGEVRVEQGATFHAPVLAEVASYVTVAQGATFHAPALAKAGYVTVAQGATFEAPALAAVAGGVIVAQGATFEAPKLKR